MKPKLYDLVKQLLEKYPRLRDSDKDLVWCIWGEAGFLTKDSYKRTVIGREYFMSAPFPDSITRARRMIQKRHTELRGSKWVEEKRKEKEAEKGTHVFREEI